MELMKFLPLFLLLAAFGHGQQSGKLPLETPAVKREPHIEELWSSMDEACNHDLTMGKTTKRLRDIFPEECGVKALTGDPCGFDVNARGFKECEKSIVPAEPEDVPASCHIERYYFSDATHAGPPPNLKDGWNKADDLRIVCHKVTP